MDLPYCPLSSQRELYQEGVRAPSLPPRLLPLELKDSLAYASSHLDFHQGCYLNYQLNHHLGSLILPSYPPHEDFLDPHPLSFFPLFLSEASYQ